MDATKRFAAVEKEFFTAWVKRHPLFAVSLGILDEHADRMPDGSLEHELDDLKLLHRTLADVKAVDAKKLDPVRQVDHAFALHHLESGIFTREKLGLWEMLPEAPRMVGQAIFQLLSRSQPGLNLRLRSIMKRLERMPAYIDESRSKLRRPVKLYIENELETLSRLPSFFNHLKSISFDHLPPTPQRQLHRLIEGVQNALQKYEDWLIIDVLPESRADWVAGEDMLRRILEARGIPESPATLLRRAEEEVERLRERLKEIGRSIKRKALIEDIRDSFKQQHPDAFDGAMRFVRDAVGKLKQFVNRSKFATLPDHEGLFVVETPTFLRHYQPLSTYQGPCRFESKEVKRDGYFFLTPGDCDSDKLKEHNYAALLVRAIQGTYPGRHLQASWGHRHPSAWRAFAEAPETVEGWMHYVEERVREMGYDDSPGARFMGTVDQLYRAGMTVIDLRLHTGRMTTKQAVEYLIDNVGTDRVAAEAEVCRYVSSPGGGVSSFYGKERIKDLRKQVKETMRGRYSDTFFHTSFLQAAPLPLHLMKLEIGNLVEAELRKPAVKSEEEARNHRRKGKADAKAPAPPAKAKKAARKPAATAKAASKARPRPKAKPRAKSKPASRRPSPPRGRSKRR